MRAIMLLVLTLLLYTSAVPAYADPSSEDILAMFEARNRSIAKTMEAATVFVLVDKGDSYNLGSGFVVADGYIMTNGHVLGHDYKNSQTIIVMNPTIGHRKASLVKMDYKDKVEGDHDMALLKMTSPAKLPVLTFNTNISRMDRVSAWGFPNMVIEHDQSLEKIVSGDLRKAPPVVYTDGKVNTIVSNNGFNTIIHSAAIASGNSGGPLINSRGEVVGINTWGYMADDEGAFYNASQPSAVLVAFMQKCGVTPKVSNGNGSALPLHQESVAGNEDSSQQAAADSGDDEAVISKRIGNSEATPRTTDEADDDSASIADLKRRAKKGDAEAQTLLGYAFFSNNDEVDYNRSQAMTWLRSAAENGNIEAQSLLTVLLYDGESLGIPRDVDECAYWAKACSAQGDPEGTGYLAQLYYYGEGVNRDENKALKLATKAAKEDNSKGKSILGWMHYLGRPLEEDDEKARLLATEAAESQDPSAQGLLAIIYYNGDGVEKDAKTAEGWARRAADQANEFGQYVMAHIYMDGEVVKRDMATALAYLQLAAEKDHKEAMEEWEELKQSSDRKTLRQAEKIISSWRREWNAE